MASVLLLEPFYSGSHKQLMDVLHTDDSDLITLPGKKWQWRARTSALWFSQNVRRNHNYRTLFASSVLNLAELVALRPDLSALHKVLYFHENQLVYPVRKQQDRDFQFGYNQILSSLVADVVLFNSKYNMESFLTNISTHLRLMPDHRPKDIADQIQSKCNVLHFPLAFPVENKHDHCFTGGPEQEGKLASENHCSLLTCGTDDETVKKDQCKSAVDSTMLSKAEASALVSASESLGHSQESVAVRGTLNEQNMPLDRFISPGTTDENFTHTALSLPKKRSKLDPLHIVWPHRWEHDKDPEMFFRVMLQLDEAGVNFTLSVLGEQFTDVPDIFEESQVKLCKRIRHWGHQSSKQDYYNILQAGDCVVSTAKHEFFGVAMLEAVHLGCFPLCPNKLVYPEFFPKECLYNTEKQLFKKLHMFCRNPELVRLKDKVVNTEQFLWNALKAEFFKFIYNRNNGI